MRRRWALIVLALTLGGIGAGALAHGMQRPRHPDHPRARRGTIHVAIVTLALTLLADIFDDIGNFGETVWGYVTGGLDSAGRAIISAVRAVVDGLRRAVQAAINGVWAGISYAANAVLSFAESVASALWSAVQAVGAALWSAIAWVGNLIGDVAAQLWNGLSAVLSWAGQEFLSLLNQISSAVLNALSWVWDNVFKPLLSAIDDVVRWVAEQILNALKWVWDQVWSVLKGLVDALTNLVGQIWSYLEGAVVFVVNVVMAALDWLLWFARHTIGSIEALIELAGKGGARALLDAVTHALLDAGSSIEELVASMFD